MRAKLLASEMSRAMTEPDDVHTGRGRRGEDRARDERLDRAKPGVGEAQPGEGEPGGAGVHYRLPPRGEPRVYPRQRATERELEVERGVDDDG